MLKTGFHVSSDHQGCQPDDLSVSVMLSWVLLDDKPALLSIEACHRICHTHRNGKVVRVTVLDVTWDNEACHQRLQWQPVQSSWRPFRFSGKLLSKLMVNQLKDVYPYSPGQKTPKLRVTCLCAGNSPVTGEFPAQKASNAKMFAFDDVIMGQCDQRIPLDRGPVIREAFPCEIDIICNHRASKTRKFVHFRWDFRASYCMKLVALTAKNLFRNCRR